MRDDGMGCGTLIVLAVIGFFVWKWYDGRGPWTGWIYPNANDLTYSIKLGQFKDFETCQNAAISGLRSLVRASDWTMEEGTYECGRRCRFDERMGIDVCKETRD